MKAQVKRCPFCNSHNLTMDRTHSVSNIRCFECGAVGPNAWENSPGATDLEAIKLWNAGYRNPDALVALPPAKREGSNQHDLKEVDLN